MIVRRWPQWVVAEYADEGGSIFGGGLLRVVDSRESVAAQGIRTKVWENERDQRERSSLVPEPRADRSPT